MKLNDITLLRGDNCDLLETLPDGCLDAVITSPVFDQLRKPSDSYATAFDFDRLSALLWSKMAADSCLVWQIYDSVTKGDKSCTSFRHALKFRELGFKLWELAIYQKSSMYHRSANRFYSAFELVYIFTKGKPPIHIPKTRPNATAGRIENGKRREAMDYASNIFYAHQGRHKQKAQGDTTQFAALMPLSLANQLTACFAPKRDGLICDVFGGAQTQCLATLQQNALDGGKRRYLGLEKATGAFKIGVDRVNRMGVRQYGLSKAIKNTNQVGWDFKAKNYASGK